MKRRVSLIVCICMILTSLSTLIGCTRQKVSVGDMVLYTEGIPYVKTDKIEPEEVYALSYEGLGGEDVMPIGGFYAPFVSGGSDNGNDSANFISDEIFKAISDAGVNTLVYSPDRYSGGSSGKGIHKALDLCEKYQMGYFVDVYWIFEQLGTRTKDVPLEEMPLSQPGGIERLGQLVDEIKTNSIGQERKSLLGFMSMDEPFPKQLDNMKVLFDAFYSLPNTKGMDLYVNALGAWTESNNFYGQSNPMEHEEYMDMFFELNPKMYSITQYPFSQNTTEEDIAEYLFSKLSLYRRYANRYKVPVWRMLQAGGQFNDLAQWVKSEPPYPDEGEMLFDVNVSLAYGCKGIQYFPLIQPLHFAMQEGETYDYENRNGLFGAAGNKTRWYYYAQRANQQIKAVDEYLMHATNDGIIVHGDLPSRYLIDKKDENGYNIGIGEELIRSGKYRELVKVDGDDCVVGCFNYKGGTALYVVNYNRKEKGNVSLTFDNNRYKYKIIQRARSCDVVGGTIGLTLDRGEGALIVLD